MFRIQLVDRAIKSLAKLQIPIRYKTDRLLEVLAFDFKDKRLRVKKLNSAQEMYSFRISIDYRAIFIFEDEMIIKILDVRHRKDVYRRMR